MLLSLRKNGLTSLFKEVRVFKGGNLPLRGLCGGLSEGSAGLSGVLRKSAGFSEVSRG